MASDEKVRLNMAEWYLPDRMFEEARVYTNKLATQSMYSKNVLFEYVLSDVRGILCCCFTLASNRAYQADVVLNTRGGMITMPEFLYYEVWFFERLALFNFAGMTEREFGGTKLEEPLGGILERIFAARGEQRWRQTYCHIEDGDYTAALRRVLHEGLGIPILLEVTVGILMYGFNGLDAYVKALAAGMPSPEEEAWYLLNGEYGARAQPIDPPEWYTCRTWYSMGQRGSITMTPLVNIRQRLERITQCIAGRDDGMTAAARATRILGHMTGVLPQYIPRELMPRDLLDVKGKGKGKGKGIPALMPPPTEF